MSTNVTRRNFVKLAGAAAATSALAACGGSDGGTDAGSAAAADGAAFTFGHIGPLTGDIAIYGKATEIGAQVAINEVNEAGTTAATLLSADDQGDGEISVNAYHDLLDQGMQILVGCTTTGACVAVSSETNVDRVFQLTPSASSADVVGDDTGVASSEPRKDNVFQMCFTDPAQGEFASNLMKEHGLGTKIGVIYRSDDAYSTGILATFKATCEANGQEIVAEEAFTGDNATDFNAQLNSCKDAGADLVFLPIYYTPASLILAQADSMGYAPTFFGVDGMDGILDLEGFDAALAEGVMFLTPFTAFATDDATVDFVAKYEELSDGTAPNQFAADAYDCVKAIVQAIEANGITPDMSTEEICDALIAAFTAEDFSYSGLTGTDMTWDETGMVTKDPQLFVIKGGAYEAM